MYLTGPASGCTLSAPPGDLSVWGGGGCQLPPPMHLLPPSSCCKESWGPLFLIQIITSSVDFLPPDPHHECLLTMRLPWAQGPSCCCAPSCKGGAWAQALGVGVGIGQVLLGWSSSVLNPTLPRRTLVGSPSQPVGLWFGLISAQTTFLPPDVSGPGELGPVRWGKGGRSYSLASVGWCPDVLGLLSSSSSP